MTASSARIAAVHAWAVPYREPNDHGSLRCAALVRVVDSDGVVGWGEAATIDTGAARATVELCRAHAAHLLGRPADPSVAMAAMRTAGWWYGGAGIDSFAVSAIDMALWNVRSAAEGESLADLLAAATRSAPRPLPRLLSLHATRGDLDAAAAEIVAGARERGCIGAKVAFGKAGEARLGIDPARDIAFVQALRREGGEDFAVMVDIAPSLGWALDDVLARSEAFEAAGVSWIEEPLGDRDPVGYARLRELTGLRLAYGEREWSPRGVSELLATGHIDVVGIDPGRHQGVTGFLAAAALCERAGVQANAHAFAGPLIAATAEAASSVSPACRVFEVAPRPNELRDLIDGREGGGLDEAAVARRALR